MTAPDDPDLAAVARISAVPTILRVIERTTGLRLALLPELHLGAEIPPLRSLLRQRLCARFPTGEAEGQRRPAMFELFAELIGLQLEAEERQFATEEALLDAGLSCPPIRCDRDRLALVPSNLLMNAIEHGSELPVEVELSCTDAEVRPRPGLGLGRYIVSQIIQAHRGRIDVDSAPDGTTFTCTLPIS